MVLINAYRKNLMTEKAEKAVIQLNALAPDHPDAAEEVIKNTVLLKPEEEKNWSKLLGHIAYSRTNPVSRKFFGIIFREIQVRIPGIYSKSGI